MNNDEHELWQVESDLYERARDLRQANEHAESR
jgi:hypothetical protein